MSWGRNEVGGLLMAGASIIAAFETAIFSKWVDSQIDGNAELSSLIAWVGFISIVLFSIAWAASRVVMNRTLPNQNKLKWRISALILFIYSLMASGWFYAGYNKTQITANKALTRHPC